VSEDGFDFEIDTDRTDEGRRETVIGVSKQERRLPHGTVPYDKKFEHVVEVLVGGVFLPLRIGSGHLRQDNSVRGDKDHRGKRGLPSALT
jgi:hypothetical protein